MHAKIDAEKVSKIDPKRLQNKAKIDAKIIKIYKNGCRNRNEMVKNSNLCGGVFWMVLGAALGAKR